MAGPFSIQEVSVYRPSHSTPRIAPQWSVFTIHPHPTEDFSRRGRVSVWSIPDKKTCREIKLVLDSCGINYASIYPDLTGGLLQKEIATGKDPEAKAWATQALPTVQAHLDKVTQLAVSLGSS
jgi:hypothetical protein